MPDRETACSRQQFRAFPSFLVRSFKAACELRRSFVPISSLSKTLRMGVTPCPEQIRELAGRTTASRRIKYLKRQFAHRLLHIICILDAAADLSGKTVGLAYCCQQGSLGPTAARQQDKSPPGPVHLIACGSSLSCSKCPIQGAVRR